MILPRRIICQCHACSKLEDLGAYHPWLRISSENRPSQWEISVEIGHLTSLTPPIFLPASPIPAGAGRFTYKTGPFWRQNVGKYSSTMEHLGINGFKHFKLTLLHPPPKKNSQAWKTIMALCNFHSLSLRTHLRSSEGSESILNGESDMLNKKKRETNTWR